MRHVVLSVPLMWALFLGIPERAFAEDGVAKPPALELSFQEAVRMAGEKPAGVIVSHERIQQALARFGQARSALLPQLSVTASQSRQTRNLESQGITIPGRDSLVGPFNTFDARIRLTQALFDAETLEGLKMARLGRDLALEQKRKARQDAMALVGTLYVEAARAEDGIALARALRERDQKELAVARSQVKQGAGPQTGVDEAEARLAESDRLLAAAKAKAVERRLDFLAALDLPVDQAIVFKEELQLPASGSPGALTPEGLESHPDVAVARKALERSQSQAGLVKAGYAPKVSATADYGESGKEFSNSVETYQYGVQVSVPVFEGGQRQAKVQEAAHQVQEAQAQMEDARVQTQARALGAAESLTKSWVAVQAKAVSLRVADRECALARHRMDLGIGTELEWVERKAKQAQAKDDWEEAVAIYRIARISLAQALGKMESLHD